MTPASTRRLEAFFLAAARAAEVELHGLDGAWADAGEVAERALAEADVEYRLARDERTRAWSALSRWASADVSAGDLPAIFRATAQLFAESIAARRSAELEVSRAADVNAQRRTRIGAAQRVAQPAPTIH